MRQALAVVSGLVDRIKAHRPKLADPFIAPLSDGGLQMEWRSYASATLVLVIPSEAAQIEYLLDVQESTGVVESGALWGSLWLWNMQSTVCGKWSSRVRLDSSTSLGLSRQTTYCFTQSIRISSPVTVQSVLPHSTKTARPIRCPAIGPSSALLKSRITDGQSGAMDEE